MRILLVADVSAERVLGGAERMLVHHVRALVGAGHEVSVLTRQPAPDTQPEIDLGNGVREYRLPFSGDKGVQGLWQLQRGADAWWRAHGGAFDAVIAEQPFVIWALLRAGCRLPRLQVVHSFAYQEYATRHGLDWGVRHRLVTAAMRRLEAGIYRSATRLLVLSKHMQHELEACFALPASRIDVVPGGVDLPDMPGKRVRAAIRRELDWHGPVVVTLRNLVPRTGVDLLVQAAAILRHNMPDVRWCVIGSGPLDESLAWLAGQLQLGDIIEFAGYLPEQEVVRRMQAADAFMIPTRSLEGFGLVTIEANACGLPVVATPVGGNIEVASSSPDNRVADAVSPEALADAMLDVLSREEDHMLRSKRLRSHMAEAFSWSAHDAGLLSAVERLR